MHIKRLASVLMVAIAASLGVGISLAGASHGVPYQPSGVTVTPASPAPGGAATVTAGGYGPGTTATVWISSTHCRRESCRGVRHGHFGFQFIKLGSAPVDANGNVTDDVTIPRGFAPHSTHIVLVLGVNSNGRPLTETARVTLSGGHHHHH